VQGSVRGLARGTVLYGMGEVLSRLFTLLLLPVFTKYLTPADYGVISILTALGLLLTPVFSLGLGAAIAQIYFDGNNRERKDGTIGTTTALLAASTAVLVLGGIALSAPISSLLFNTQTYAGLVIVSIVTTAFTILAVPFRQRLQFEERATAYVVLSTLSIVATTAFSVVLVVGLRRGVHGVLEGSLAGQAVGFGLFAAFGSGGVRPRFDRPLVRELLKTSLPLVPAFGCLFLLQHGSKYLLQWLAGLDAVGLYTVGLNLGLVISLVVTAFQTAWIPYFMSFAERRAEAEVVFGRVLTYYVLAIGGLSLAVFAVARPVVLLMTAPPFHPAWRVVGVSATAQFLAGIYGVLLPGMYLAKEVQFTAALQGIAAAAVIVFGVLLIPRFGVGGAAASLVLSYLVLDVVQYVWNRRRAYLAVRYQWGRIAAFTVVYVCYAAAALWNRNLGLGRELLFAMALLAVLPAILYASIDRSERRALWTLARDWRSQSTSASGSLR